MCNILNIAKKEFSDLVGSKFIIISILVYLLVIFIDLYSTYDLVHGNNFTGSLSVMSFLAALLSVLTDYGSILGICVGFSVMFVEKRSGTLNTLLAKPLYRDTIINGKLLGSLLFLVCVLVFSALIYCSGLLVLFGNALVPMIVDFFIRVPVVVLLSLLYVIIYFCIALLFSILIRNDVFALFFSLLVWVLFVYVFTGATFCDNIAILVVGSNGDYNGLANSISELFPSTSILLISRNCQDIFNVIGTNGVELVRLFLYVVVTAVISYIAFIRRDVA